MDVKTGRNVEIGANKSKVGGDKSSSDCQILPGFLDGAMRRHYLQEMVKTLPEPVQKRLAALKDFQVEHLQLDTEYFKECCVLEKMYNLKCRELFDKRAEIVKGVVDPPDEEPKWQEPKKHYITDKDNEEGEQGQEEDESSMGDEVRQAFMDIISMPQDAKGIPGFWLNAFQNMTLMSDLIQTNDEPVLRMLMDVVVTYGEDHSFTIEFHFEKNEYFSNAVLVKQFFRTSTFDPKDPFTAQISEIYKCKGCKINWEHKMDLTQKTMRKKQKQKDKDQDASPMVMKYFKHSFFNFFRRPTNPLMHYEIGHFLRTKGVPKAVLYYTGDVMDDEYEEDEDEEEEEEEEEEGTSYNDEASSSKTDSDHHQ